MKKTVFLLGLLTSAVCLTACGSKTFEMSFEEALNIASHSEFQDILTQSDNIEQDFNIAGSFDSEWTKIDANISSNTKENISKKNSESSTKFTANVTASWEIVKLNWALDIKLIDDTVYLNISSLDLTWSDGLSMVAMMVEWFKNQWFSIPMTWLNDAPNSLSMIKDSDELDAKIKEIVINEWSVTYNWTFSEFNGYNARKFSLDNDKLNELIKEYYEEYYNALNSELGEESIEELEIPIIDIQNFEWYLVITWKDKVTTVIENMAIAQDEEILNVNWYAGEDFVLYLSDGENNLVSIVANKKGSKYEVSTTIADAVSLVGTVSSKLSKSSVDLKFDATLRVKAEEEWTPDIVVPFKGSWNYKTISDFTVVAPESAQDLTELLWSYLGGLMWWDAYNEEYDYEDLYLDEVGEELEESNEEATEVKENMEAVENVEVEENAEVVAEVAE